ncbi:Rad52/Rad22 family DNA repair protein [Streptomyces sp. NPDC088739]|uniref:Rad52/Rad22 family DNA repair protein n=1 Tax=Streptomyces sp. NPDC088739 TaxID=3365882 RepID=UPI00380E3743
MMHTDTTESPARELLPVQAFQPAQLTRPPVRLSKEQRDALEAELNAARIAYDDRGNAHIPGWDVRATLTRIFGFGMWSEEITERRLVQDQKYTPDGHWHVSWLVSIRLTCWDPYGTPLGPYEGISIDTVTQGNRGACHELAVKSAATTALKRAAINLGQQFGLSLYRKSGGNPAPKGARPKGIAVSSTLQPVYAPEDGERAPLTEPVTPTVPAVEAPAPVLPGRRPEDVVPKQPATAPDEAAATLDRERAELRDLVVNLGAAPEELDAATVKTFGVVFDYTTLEQVRTLRTAIEKRSARRG